MNQSGIIEVSPEVAINAMAGARPDEIGVYWGVFFLIARSDAARISTMDRRIFNLLDAPDHYVERVVGLLIDRGALILRDGWLELPQGSPMVWL
jgi:hypothetical protein